LAGKFDRVLRVGSPMRRRKIKQHDRLLLYRHRRQSRESALQRVRRFGMFTSGDLRVACEAGETGTVVEVEPVGVGAVRSQRVFRLADSLESTLRVAVANRDLSIDAVQP
jgi:hypothetical protein